MKVNYTIKEASKTKFEILRDDANYIESPVAVVVDITYAPSVYNPNVNNTYCTLSFMHDRAHYALDLLESGKLEELLKNVGFEFNKEGEIYYVLKDIEFGTAVKYIEGMNSIDYNNLYKAYYKIDRKAESEKTKLVNELTEKIKSRKSGVGV